MKNSFVIYHNYLENLEDLTDEQFGKLFRALFHYEIKREEPGFTGSLKIAFNFIKQDLDANLEKYENICERNRLNGLKGGRPRNPSGFQENPRNPSGFQENPKQPKKADNDNEYDNENDIYMQVSKKEEKNNNYLNVYSNTRTHEIESYDDIFESMYVSHELKLKFIEFIKHCQVNGKIVTNDKLKDIIIRLDMAYTNDIDKIQSLKRAINSGCFDIQEGRG